MIKRLFGLMFIFSLALFVRVNAAHAAATYGASTIVIDNTSPAATQVGIDLQPAVTASGGFANGMRLQQTLTASANNDVLTGLYINPTFADNSKTGVTHNGLIVASGNVGIATTAPNEKLEVTGGARVGQAPSTLTTLSDNPLTSGATTVNVASTTGYPLAGTLHIDVEAMIYTGTTATSFTGVTRGALGTTAASHTQNSTINNYLLTVQSVSSVLPAFYVRGNGVTGIGATSVTDGQYSLFLGAASGRSALNILEDKGADASTFNRVLTFSNNAYSQSYGSVLISSDTVRYTSGNNMSLSLGTNSGDIKFDVGTNATMRAATIQGTTGNVGIGTTAPTEVFDVNSNNIRVRTANTPASAGATCDQGEIAWDTSFIYVCVATNTWKRSAIATW